MRDHQLPALPVEGQLLHPEIVGEADPAVERRDDRLDVAPLLHQAGELVDRDLEVDGVVTRPRRFLGAEAELAVVGPLHREAHVDDPSEQRRAVGERVARFTRLGRATAAFDDVEHRRRVGGIEPQRTRLVRLREQTEQLRQCERFQRSLQHDIPPKMESVLVTPSAGKAVQLERPPAKRCESVRPTNFRSANFRPVIASATLLRPRRASPRPARLRPSSVRSAARPDARACRDRRRPRRRGRARPAGVEFRAGGTRGRRTPARGARRRGAAGARRVSVPRSIPTGVAFTTRFAAVATSARSDQGAVAPPASPAATAAASGLRAHTRTVAPAAPRARATARAAPPAPRTTTPMPAGS